MNQRNFFIEPKGRHLSKVAWAYAIVGGMAIQIVSLTFPSFELPIGTLRLVMLLIFLGFPIALVLTWAFTCARYPIPEALSRCKPLSDPVQFIAGGLLRIMILLLLTLPFAVVAVFKSEDSQNRLAPLIGTTAFLSASLAVWLLLNKGKRVPVIYLRAFRVDQSSSQLQTLLKAALGNRFRLSGIRPPRKRLRVWLQPFAQLWMALRYAGSQHFEFVAEDHNWMARLLASYARARLVFVDVRDLTTHVENEMRLSYLAMGAERCIFITDPTRSPEEWVCAMRSTLLLAPTEQPLLRLLEYPREDKVDPHTFVAMARTMIDATPNDPPAITDEAVSFAKSYMPKRAWKTRPWETDAGRRWVGMVVIVVWSAVSGVIKDISSWAASPIMSVIAICAQLLNIGLLLFFCFIIVATAISYVIAWARAWRQSGIEARFKRIGDPSPRLRAGLSFVFAIMSLGVLAFAPVAETYIRQRTTEVARKELHQSKITPESSGSPNAFSPQTKDLLPQDGPVSWHWFSIEVPSGWRRAETEKESLTYVMDQKYACGFTFHRGPEMAFGSLPPAEVLAQRSIDAFSTTSAQTRVLEKKQSNLIGIDSYTVHLHTKGPDGDAVVRIRVSVYGNDALVIKAVGVGVPDDDAQLQTIFIQGSTAVTEERRRD